MTSHTSLDPPLPWPCAGAGADLFRLTLLPIPGGDSVAFDLGTVSDCAEVARVYLASLLSRGSPWGVARVEVSQVCPACEGLGRVLDTRKAREVKCRARCVDGTLQPVLLTYHFREGATDALEYGPEPMKGLVSGAWEAARAC